MFILGNPEISEMLRTHARVYVLEIASSGLKVNPYLKSAEGKGFIKEPRTKHSFFETENDPHPPPIWSVEEDHHQKFLRPWAVNKIATNLKHWTTKARAEGAGVIIYSTSLLRDAANGEIVRAKLEKKLHEKVGVISGNEEGFLEAYALLDRRPEIRDHQDRYAMLGIGGGSTQMVLFKNDHMHFKGASFGLNSHIKPKKLPKRIKHAFAQAAKQVAFERAYIIGNSVNRLLLDTPMAIPEAGANMPTPDFLKYFKTVLKHPPHKKKSSRLFNAAHLITGLFNTIQAHEVVIERSIYPSDGIFHAHGFTIKPQGAAPDQQHAAPRLAAAS